MKRGIYILVIVLLSLVAMPAQAQLSRLHFGGYTITSLQAQSFSTVAGSARITVTNDTTTFVMSGIKGTVYKLGVPMVDGRAEDIRVPHGKSDVNVRGVASLCEGISVWNVVSCLFGFNINDYTVDISMTITDSAGNQRDFAKDGMSVAAILGNVMARKN